MKITHPLFISLSLALALPIVAGCAAVSESMPAPQRDDLAASESLAEAETRFQHQQKITGTRLRLAQPEGRWHQPLLSYPLVTHDDEDLDHAGERELDRALELINATVLGIPTGNPELD